VVSKRQVTGKLVEVVPGVLAELLAYGQVLTAKDNLHAAFRSLMPPRLQL
jgi:hypothetical protein